MQGILELVESPAFKLMERKTRENPEKFDYQEYSNYLERILESNNLGSFNVYCVDNSEVGFIEEISNPRHMVVSTIAWDPYEAFCFYIHRNTQ
jgi:hypothetical protein